jgi:muconate cycloisomerase
MRIVELALYAVHLPLRKAVKHAAFSRSESLNIIVRARLADGTEGWGEGVPREYVTGETIDGTFAQLSETALTEQLGGDCTSWREVIELCERFEPAGQGDSARGCYGNALRCAVELSILDAFGRLFGESLSAVTSLCEPALSVSLTQVRYSAVITAESPWTERASALKIQLYGFAHCKVKVGVSGQDDSRRLRSMRRWMGRQMDLRLDVNAGWRARNVLANLTPLLAYDISCVEQPVPHEEIAALADLRREIPTRVMLDESLTSMPDALEAVRLGACDLFNLRLSKCGGFLRCLRLAAVAKRAGLGYQLGCHPGESGILSAAGRHWATSVCDIHYLEGSYDRHILVEPLTREDLTFGYAGFAPALRGPGLGVTIDREALARRTVREVVHRLDV